MENKEQATFGKIRFFIILFLILAGITMCIDLGYIFYKTNLNLARKNTCQYNFHVNLTIAVVVQVWSYKNHTFNYRYRSNHYSRVCLCEFKNLQFWKIFWKRSLKLSQNFYQFCNTVAKWQGGAGALPCFWGVKGTFFKKFPYKDSL